MQKILIVLTPAERQLLFNLILQLGMALQDNPEYPGSKFEVAAGALVGLASRGTHTDWTDIELRAILDCIGGYYSATQLALKRGISSKEDATQSLKLMDIAKNIQDQACKQGLRLVYT